RRVGTVAVRHPRKPQDGFALRPGAPGRRGAHDRFDLACARSPRYQAAAGVTRATGEKQCKCQRFDRFHIVSISLRAGSTRTQSPLRNTSPGCGAQPAVIGMPANTAPCTITGLVTPKMNALGAIFFHLMS